MKIYGYIVVPKDYWVSTKTPIPKFRSNNGKCKC